MTLHKLGWIINKICNNPLTIMILIICVLGKLSDLLPIVPGEFWFLIGIPMAIIGFQLAYIPIINQRDKWFEYTPPQKQKDTTRKCEF